MQKKSVRLKLQGALYSYADTKGGYQHLWAQAYVKPAFVGSAQNLANRISASRSLYDPVEAATKAPWFFVGLLHMREASLAPNTYLGDGSPLRGRWSTFAAGANYALSANRLSGIANWPVSFCLWAAEKFNGQGYFARGINSPYLWSWTNLYSQGKYIGDGLYSPTTVDPQPGVAAVLGELIAHHAAVAAYFTAHPEEPVTITTPPMPAPPPPAPDIYASLIAMLQAAGKLPPPCTIDVVTNASGGVSINLAGNFTLTANGQPVQFP